jgi:hypothetical protein
MTKYDKVKEHLKSGQSITGLEALQLYGLYRLSSLINKLRGQDWPIKTVIVEAGSLRYAKYFIPISERGKHGN